MLRRVPSATTCWPVATAVAALAANASMSRSSSALNVGLSPSPSNAAITPSARSRNSNGTTSSACASSAFAHGARKPVEPGWTRCARRVRSASPPSEPSTGATHVAHLGGHLAGRRDDPQLVTLAQRDEHRPRLHEGASALDDQLQDPVEVQLAADGARDLARRLQRAHRALELVAPLAHVLVEPGVLDRDRGPVGQHDERRLVGLGELLATRPSRSGTGSPTLRRGSTIGTPRNVCISGCPIGNPYERGCSSTSASRSGCGCAISSPSTPRPARQVPDRRALRLVDRRA